MAGVQVQKFRIRLMADVDDGSLTSLMAATVLVPQPETFCKNKAQ